MVQLICYVQYVYISILHSNYLFFFFLLKYFHLLCFFWTLIQLGVEDGEEKRIKSEKEHSKICSCRYVREKCFIGEKLSERLSRWIGISGRSQRVVELNGEAVLLCGRQFSCYRLPSCSLQYAAWLSGKKNCFQNLAPNRDRSNSFWALDISSIGWLSTQ